MKPLHGKIAVVAGASRGAGRGIALALGDGGATVYVAARTSRKGPKPDDNAPGTVEDTAAEVTSRGGKGVAIRADLGEEKQVANLFFRVKKDHGRLDILANAAWSPDCMSLWSKRFWELDNSSWLATLNTVSVCWLTTVFATRLMLEQGRGLIIHVTDNLYPDPSASRQQVLWDVGHECINRLVLRTSENTKRAKIAIVGLNPGFMRTERVLMHMRTNALKEQFRFDLSESPEYIGRGVAALAADARVFRKNGQLLWASDLAKEYGFTDVDGRYIPRFDPHAPRQEDPC